MDTVERVAGEGLVASGVGFRRFDGGRCALYGDQRHCRDDEDEIFAAVLRKRRHFLALLFFYFTGGGRVFLFRQYLSFGDFEGQP